jgi:putative transposase
MDTELMPRDHAEAVAHFRVKIIGALSARELSHGDLAAGLRELSTRRFRPPGSPVTRTYSVPTLERWYHHYRSSGVEGLRPKPRSDQGYAQELTEAERELLLATRRDHRSISVKTLVRTLVTKGLLRDGATSHNSLRRLFRAHGLERQSKRHDGPGKSRRTWEAAHPGALWHADVAHGPALVVDGARRPLRIHGILDDASRYLVALQARHSEMEFDMLELLTAALRRHGRPKALYVDNGATYSGTTLATACTRLGIRLIHAEPYDPQARGKMERFWRTLREGCVDHLPADVTLHGVNMRLLAFLDRAYHLDPHSSLIGSSPGQRWGERPQLPEVTDDELHAALVVEALRRVSNTGTVSVAGIDWELEQGFLAGKKVRVFRSLLDATAAPWVEYDSRRLSLHRVDAKGNASRRRETHTGQRIDAVPFDPVLPLVDKMVGRDPTRGGGR